MRKDRVGKKRFRNDDDELRKDWPGKRRVEEGPGPQKMNVARIGAGREEFRKDCAGKKRDWVRILREELRIIEPKGEEPKGKNGGMVG